MERRRFLRGLSSFLRRQSITDFPGAGHFERDEPRITEVEEMRK